jgi:hypothetical protein
MQNGKSEYRSVTISPDATAQEFMDMYFDDDNRPNWVGGPVRCVCVLACHNCSPSQLIHKCGHAAPASYLCVHGCYMHYVGVHVRDTYLYLQIDV